MKLSRFAGIEGNVGVLRIECTRRQQFMIAVMNEINAVVDRYGGLLAARVTAIERFHRLVSFYLCTAGSQEYSSCGILDL